MQLILKKKKKKAAGEEAEPDFKTNHLNAKAKIPVPSDVTYDLIILFYKGLSLSNEKGLEIKSLYKIRHINFNVDFHLIIIFS